MRRKRMKGPDRRRQILDVALRLFAQRGYSLTTTAAIAAAAGITEPVLYRHFANKRELFLRLLEEISARAIAHLRSLADRSADPAEQLRAIITSYPEVSEQFAEPFGMIDRALASLGDGGGRAARSLPDVRPLLAQHYRAYEVLLGGIIRRGQAAGQFRDDVDPRVAAWFLIHAALGWRLSHNLRLDVFTRRSFVPQSAKLLLDGLKKSRGAREECRVKRDGRERKSVS